MLGTSITLSTNIKTQNEKVEAKMEMYPINQTTAERLERDFTYHQPKGDQSQKYELLRDEAKTLATNICKLCPPSREQSLALTKLEEAIFWANASIARNE